MPRDATVLSRCLPLYSCLVPQRQGWGHGAGVGAAGNLTGCIRFEALHPPHSCGVVARREGGDGDEGGVVVDGVLGYFTAELFGGVMLDSRHSSSERNCFHWQAFVFPLSPPLLLSLPAAHVTFTIRRTCVELPPTPTANAGAGGEELIGKGERKATARRLRMWYQWRAEVEGGAPGTWQNEGGASHSIFLP
jgi:hypothetical protein